MGTPKLDIYWYFESTNILHVTLSCNEVCKCYLVIFLNQTLVLGV